MYKYPFLQKDNIKAWYESIPKQNSGTNGYDPTKDKERAAFILGCTKLPMYIFTGECIGMQVITQADFSKGRLDIKQDITRFV